MTTHARTNTQMVTIAAKYFRALVREAGSQIDPETKMVSITVELFRALMRAIGSQIDPETVKITSWHTEVVDPYGIYPDLPEECRCIGRTCFARAPSSEIWVEFGDLPDATRDAL
jgi:hypothetical protein